MSRTQMPEIPSDRIPTVEEASATYRECRTLEAAGRHEEAVTACESLLDRLRDGTEPAHLALQVGATVLRAAALGHGGRVGEAIAIYQRVVDESAGSSESFVRECVDFALFDLGIQLNRTGHELEAERTLSTLLDRHRIPDGRPTSRQVIEAARARLQILVDLKRVPEAFACWADVMRRYGDADDPERAPVVAEGLVARCRLHLDAGRPEAARSDLELARRILRGRVPLELHQVFARAYGELAVRSMSAGKPKRTLKDFGQAIEHALSAEFPDREEFLAILLGCQGLIFLQLWRSRSALGCFDEVIQRLGESPAAAMRTTAARAMRNRGLALDQGGNPADALAAADATILRFGAETDLVLGAIAARACLDKAEVLERLGRQEECLAACAEVARRTEGSDDDELGSLARDARAIQERAEPGSSAGPGAA
jgi:tetratricopeptide (TPR) repeat protein